LLKAIELTSDNLILLRTYPNGSVHKSAEVFISKMSDMFESESVAIFYFWNDAALWLFQSLTLYRSRSSSMTWNCLHLTADCYLL